MFALVMEIPWHLVLQARPLSNHYNVPIFHSEILYLSRNYMFRHITGSLVFISLFTLFIIIIIIIIIIILLHGTRS